MVNINLNFWLLTVKKNVFDGWRLDCRPFNGWRLTPLIPYLFCHTDFRGEINKTRPLPLCSDYHPGTLIPGISLVLGPWHFTKVMTRNFVILFPFCNTNRTTLLQFLTHFFFTISSLIKHVQLTFILGWRSVFYWDGRHRFRNGDRKWPTTSTLAGETPKSSSTNSSAALAGVRISNHCCNHFFHLAFLYDRR